ncbi:tRNA1(Val) (adenine(37)-N6)-methyltransferase [Oleisolibacter albus]|uniref:tRNA1(Val) (adenine(37)-N6)-methyltransferase n=1 Tax=Oleisolibacter albus TaxID=2171757 RepID=UPI000DF1D9CE|nr:methyltransferase [Oleisolibacter albus]
MSEGEAPGPLPAAGMVEETGLLGGRVRLLQPRQGYRAAIDPVLLAAAVPAQPGERVLELGCGTGAAALCLAARVSGLDLTGLELQAAAADLARQSAALSGLVLTVVEGDLTAPPAAVAANGFHRVLMNPPYYPAGRHTASPSGHKAVSHGEGAADLAAWVQAALRALRSRGTLSVVYPVDRLDRLMALLAGRFGDIGLFPLWPRAGQPARRLLVQAVRDGRGPTRLLPGLVLHAADGRYTADADAVLRDAAPLDLGTGTPKL